MHLTWCIQVITNAVMVFGHQLPLAISSCFSFQLNVFHLFLVRRMQLQENRLDISSYLLNRGELVSRRGYALRRPLSYDGSDDDARLLSAGEHWRQRGSQAGESTAGCPLPPSPSLLPIRLSQYFQTWKNTFPW